MTSSDDISDRAGATSPPAGGLVHRIGLDWWAVIVAGVFVALALADVLPTIPW